MNMSKYKRWRVLIHRVIVKQQAKKRTDSSCVFTQSDKYENADNVNTQNDYEQIKRKQTCSSCLVNVFKFQ